MKVNDLEKLLEMILSPARLPVPPLRHVLRRLGAFQRRNRDNLECIVCE
jgi:hypothetical protein